jgi:hypothetical protein
MTMMQKTRTLRSAEDSFVIRIQRADPGASREHWRATVVHVASGERRYVTTYADLCAFIEARRRPSSVQP